MVGVHLDAVEQFVDENSPLVLRGDLRRPSCRFAVDRFLGTQHVDLGRDAGLFLLRGYARAGWELVTFSTTVKTVVNVSGSDLIATFKRPGSGEIDPTADAALGIGASDVQGWI